MSAVATVKGGLYESAGLGTLTQAFGKGGQRRQISRLLSTKGMRAMQWLEMGLTGTAPGATATETNAVVAASAELGGKREIEAEVLVSRATTTADAVEIITTLLYPLYYRTIYASNPLSAVTNKDGNPLGTR